MILVLAEAERNTRNVVEQINMRFSEEQNAAIMHVDGPMMVIAGPGSGKTTVITQRIKYLIESAGVSPADILVITFTRAAAQEMKSRFQALTKGKSYPVRFGTFHSVFFWIIKTAYRLSNENVISEEEKRKLLSSAMEKSLVDAQEYGSREDVENSILSQISLVKCDMIDIDSYYSRDFPEEEFRKIYREMDSVMKRAGKIDFDDMMVMCYELLMQRKDILEQCRKMFRYILVDEFQDSNKLQYEIFKLLSFPLENAFVVGDDDQSVYGFRGARPEIMQQFERDFSGVKKVFLGVNYRCDRRITLASQSVINENKNRFQKNLISKSREDGVVKVIVPEDSAEENEMIASQIRLHYDRGIPYEKQAVLYRINVQPRKLAYKLDQFNIPYHLSDRIPNLLEHFVIKNVMDYMRLAAGDLSKEVFSGVMNKPSRYISRDLLLEDPVDLEKLIQRAQSKSYVEERLVQLVYDLKLLRKMRPYAALAFIRKSMGYDEYIKNYAKERNLDGESFLDTLDEFADMITDMGSYEELFEFAKTYGELLRQNGRKKENKGVSLMTMHSAKGLEFDCVYILDAVEGFVPYKKAKTGGELEEERRMFYVAMTRARHELYVYAPKTISGSARKASRFLSNRVVRKNKREG